MEAVTVPVAGMRCGGCESSVARAIQALAGVESALADHVAEEVEVRYDPASVGLDDLRRAIEEAGFTPLPSTSAPG